MINRQKDKAEKPCLAVALSTCRGFIEASAKAHLNTKRGPFEHSRHGAPIPGTYRGFIEASAKAHLNTKRHIEHLARFYRA